MSRELAQRLGFAFLTLVTAVVVLPILLVVGYVVVQGAPGLSWEFLSAMPRGGMREGGILPAIVGTLWLTAGTAVFAVPLGVAMAIYLAEYAADNTFTRLVRLSIINLAGIPSVVYGLFGLGLFVLFLGLGSSILAGALTLAIMTLPGHHQHVGRSAARGAAGVSHGQHQPGRDQVADDLSHHFAAGLARHPHRRHPGPGTRGGRDGAHLVHGGGVLFAAPAARGV